MKQNIIITVTLYARERTITTTTSFLLVIIIHYYFGLNEPENNHRGIQSDWNLQ